jgi:hypothetical protein
VSTSCRVAVAWTLNAAALLVSGVHYHRKKGMKDDIGVLAAIGTWQATSGFMILRALSFFMDLHWAILQRTPGDIIGNLGVARPLTDSSKVRGMPFELQIIWVGSSRRSIMCSWLWEILVYRCSKCWWQVNVQTNVICKVVAGHS